MTSPEEISFKTRRVDDSFKDRTKELNITIKSETKKRYDKKGLITSRRVYSILKLVADSSSSPLSIVSQLA